MELTFLGTSSGAPTKQRNVTGVALRIDGKWDLFDCGEATQHQLMHTPLALSKLRRVFISHLHGDHCFGLFGLLGSRSLDRSASPLTVFGPTGLRAMVDVVLDTTSTFLTYPLEIVEVDDTGGRVIDDPTMTVDAIPLTHRVTSFAWSMCEAERPGRLDIDAAKAAGVPLGPALGRLKRGESVELDDGRRVDAADVLGPVQPGRRIVIAGDNSAPDALFDATSGADVAVHEATYTEPVLAELGDDHGHSTAARVAAAAERTGVRNLLLTHLSARFAEPGQDSTLTIDDVRDEARDHFTGGLHLAHDLDRVVIAHDGSTCTVVPASSEAPTAPAPR